MFIINYLVSDRGLGMFKDLPGLLIGTFLLQTLSL